MTRQSNIVILKKIRGVYMFCSKCGAEVKDEAVICPSCGCIINEELLYGAMNKSSIRDNSKTNNDFTIAVKILMIIACIGSGFWLIPLAWTVPMTCVYFNKVKNNQPISVGFKVCTLLFVSMIAGILMFCDNQQK